LLLTYADATYRGGNERVRAIHSFKIWRHQLLSSWQWHNILGLAKCVGAVGEYSDAR
jgi:hypothetical protein